MDAEQQNRSIERIFMAYSIVKTLAVSLICLLCGLLGASTPVFAAAPELSFPLKCTLGESCWLVNFVDRDPGPGYTDFQCGAFSYKTHKGTDIAKADDAQMRRGVAVLAAAPGIVLGTRDGMPYNTAPGGRITDGRECGNGLVIDHGDGWNTQYCHMQAGSLTVVKGQGVERGTVLGRIGRSGQTEFPHLHISVKHNGTVIDPFTGDSNIGLCNANAESRGLWAEQIRSALHYPGPQPYHLGFTDAAIDIEAVRAGKLNATRFAATSPALVFWTEIFTLKPGDRVSVSLQAPDGSTIGRNTYTVPSPKARLAMAATGKKSGPTWPTGIYVGRIDITRDGETISKSLQATVE